MHLGAIIFSNALSAEDAKVLWKPWKSASLDGQTVWKVPFDDTHSTEILNSIWIDGEKVANWDV